MWDLKNQTLLVIAPHPDDEVIGAAGLIRNIKDAHGKVYIMILTIGKTQDFSRRGRSTISERVKEIDKVAKFLQFDDYEVVFKSNDYHLRLDVVGQKEVMQIIERKSRLAIEKIKPDIVVFPSLYSYNQDHQLTARATHASLRPAETSTKHFVPLAMAYEMPSDSWSLHYQTVPNLFVRLTKSDMAAKKKALTVYRSQMRPAPNPRSLSAIESLARLRGSLSGTTFAEGYLLYRSLI